MELYFPCFTSHVVLFFSVRASDKRISCDEEFSDSEDEGEGGRRNRESFKHRKRLKVSENGEKKDADDKGETPGVTRDPLHWIPLTTSKQMQKTKCSLQNGARSS